MSTVPCELESENVMQTFFQLPQNSGPFVPDSLTAFFFFFIDYCIVK